MQESTVASLSLRHRLVTVEDGAEVTRSPAPHGATLTVGRHGDVPVGVDPEDLGISRTALRITAADSWELEVTNAAGAWIRPWAAAGRRVTQGHRERFVGGRVCVDLFGAEGRRHRVLLECDAEGPLPLPCSEAAAAELAEQDADAARAGETTRVDDVRHLTDKQVSVIRAVFGEYFAWPPRDRPDVVKFPSAARRLGISSSAVKDHLGRVRARMAPFVADGCPLDDPRYVYLDDPRYVYLLVDLGLLVYPGVRPPAE
jgi:hypothetical protein